MATISEVGAIRQVFKPSLINMWAGVILGVLLIGAGAFGWIAATKAVIDNRGAFPLGPGGWNWVSVTLVWVVATVAIPGGWLLVRWMRNLMAFKVEVGIRGLLIRERAGSRTMLWDDIEAVEEQHFFERRSHGLPPRLNQLFVLKARDGELLSFEENAINGHRFLANMIRRETDARSVPWEITQA